MIAFRNELPDLLKDLRLKGVCVELGVAGGRFSAHLLENSPIRCLYSIDGWSGDRGHGLTQYVQALRRLNVYGRRSIVVRARFEEALELFPDNSLDCVYVDGYAHTGNESGKTLGDWWPKVKAGGLLGTHDYSHHWPLNVIAVDRFFDDMGSEGQVWITARDEYPSWFLRKAPG